MYRRTASRAAAALAAATLGGAAAGCGGGGGGSASGETRRLAEAGYTVSVPAGWPVARTPRGVSSRPGAGSDELVSVTVFTLVRTYRPDLWPRAVRELDGVAERVAGQLRARIDSSRTVTVAGDRARQYLLSFERDGRNLRERITFVLRGRREYQLLCRWRVNGGEPAACGLLVASFRLT